MVNKARFYETPQNLASEIARYVPRSAKSILDPCTGNGALLKPLLLKGALLYAVDIRASAITRCQKSLLGAGRRLNVREGNFLTMPLGKWEKYMDCVIMNPPFSGKLTAYVRSSHSERSSLISIEEAFLRRGMQCLKQGGRLIAIVPPSIVCGERFTSLRIWLSSIGTIVLVHELPPFTFSHVESRVYVMVFDLKRSKGRGVALLNHSLKNPERLSIDSETVSKGLRLDFGFHAGLKQLSRLLGSTSLGWRPLGDHVAIMRGKLKSPTGKVYGVHSIDSNGGIWAVTRKVKSSPRAVYLQRLMATDLLIRRVSRNAFITCGSARLCEGLPWTDCVFVLRNYDPVIFVETLMLVRTMLGFGFSRDMLAKGAGAAFMRRSDMAKLPIPWNLSRLAPSLIWSYKKAVFAQDIQSMRRLEQSARELIAEYSGQST